MIVCKTPHAFNVYTCETITPIKATDTPTTLHCLLSMMLTMVSSRITNQRSNGPNYSQAPLNYKLFTSAGSLDVYLHILWSGWIRTQILMFTWTKMQAMALMFFPPDRATVSWERPCRYSTQVCIELRSVKTISICWTTSLRTRKIIWFEF